MNFVQNDNFSMTLACKQQASCLLKIHLLICTRGSSAGKGDCTVHFLKIGTLSSEDSDSSENIAERVNLLEFLSIFIAITPSHQLCQM